MRNAEFTNGKIAVFPNPTKSEQQVSLTMTRPGQVGIVVYDVYGRIVKHVFEGKVSPGTYSYTVDLANLSSGIYIYHVVIAGEQHNIRILKN